MLGVSWSLPQGGMGFPVVDPIQVHDKELHDFRV